MRAESVTDAAGRPEGGAVMDVAAFRAAYPAWLAEARPALEAADWKAAFVTYPFPVNGSIPWAPLERPLSECRIGLFTTAGLYVVGDQAPFDAPNIEGDVSFRAIPPGAGAAELGIAHGHFNHEVALQDLEAVFPRQRLGELAAAGSIGGLVPEAISVSGYCTRADVLAEQTAPRIVEHFRERGADAVLLVPV